MSVQFRNTSVIVPQQGLVCSNGSQFINPQSNLYVLYWLKFPSPFRTPNYPGKVADQVRELTNYVFKWNPCGPFY